MVEDDDDIDDLWSIGVEKKPITPKKSPSLVVDHNNKAPYTAFETKDKPLGFVVRCHAIHYTFFYHHLLTVVLNSPDDDFFTLITNNAVIQVYGRNLQPITAAFRLHTCDSMSEFSPDVSLPPTDDAQPYIEKIDVLLPTPPKKPEGGAKSEEKP